jgi:hypothetical protein
LRRGKRGSEGRGCDGERRKKRSESDEEALSRFCALLERICRVSFSSRSPLLRAWSGKIHLSLSLFQAHALESQRDKEREREKERKRKKETRPEGGKKKHQINAPWKRLAATTSLAAPLNVILGLLQSADEAGATAAAAAAPEVVGASAPVMVDEQRVKRTRRRRESEVDASGERSFPC